MCAIGMAIPITMTTPIVAAIRYQDSNFRGVDHSEDYKQPLSREWIVVPDEHGKRRLRMHWTTVPFFPPGKVRKVTRP